MCEHRAVTPHDDWPRLLGIDVDPDAVVAPGEALEAILKRLGGTSDGMPVPGAPAHGWRILAEPSARDTVLGAPADPAAARWHVVQLTAEGDRRALHTAPEPAPLRPSRAQSRAGLELRWPAVVSRHTPPDEFVVDVVNAGTERWTPGDDGMLVIGSLIPAGEAPRGFGWMSSQQQRGVPLDPGEYLRVPVTHSSTDWHALEPGRHELHAHLVAVGLTTPLPFVVEISASDLTRLRAARSANRRSPAERRRSLENQRLRVEAQLAVSADPARLIEIVRHADSDDAAVAAIGASYAYDREIAEAVYRSMLSELLPANAQRSRRELAMIAHSIARLDD